MAAKKRAKKARSAAQIAAQHKAAMASANARKGKGGADRRASLATLVKRSTSTPGKTRNPWATPENEKKWAAEGKALQIKADAARKISASPAFLRTAKKMGPNASYDAIVSAMSKKTKKK